MTVSIAVVMSVDAKITRHGDPDIHGWASDEDNAHFLSLRDRSDVLIMGRNTYEAMRPNLALDQPTKRFVLTSHPENFQSEAVPDRLEFVKQSSTELVKQLQKQAVGNVLIVGGPPIYSELLRNGLVDYFYITVEPRLFGQGTALFADLPVDIKLKLIESRQLNSQGSLLLKYQAK